MKILLQALLISAACAGATPAASKAPNPAAAPTAISIPDVKGKWVGTSETVFLGNAPHQDPGAATNYPGLGEIEVTYNIEGQSGRRFWGTLASARSQERLVGLISFDGKTVYMRDPDGAMEGVLTDKDTMEIVYGDSGESLVVALIRFKRKR